MLLDFPAIDAHFHWWSRGVNDYPWLAPGSRRPAMGDHRALMRDFGFAEHMREVGGLMRLVGGVHVEAGCADPLAEARWVAGEAERHAFPLVHVARVDLTDEAAPRRVAELGEVPLVRGVRMRLNADPRIAGRAGIADEPVFRRGFAALAERGLHFGLSLYPGQSGEGARLARDFPGTSLVLDHLGWPRFAEGLDSFEDWRAGMRELAACPNMTVKLSMLWPIDRDWRSDVIRPFVLEAIALFGIDRVMWGSNFPVETAMGTARHQLASLLEVLRGLSGDEFRAVFRDNAARVFGLDRAVEAAA